MRIMGECGWLEEKEGGRTGLYLRRLAEVSMHGHSDLGNWVCATTTARILAHRDAGTS